MEIDPTTTNKAVKEILDQMISELPRYRWESICVNADVIGRTIIEVNVYSAGGSRMNGRLVYQLETGEVLDWKYQGLETAASESVIDIVLDIANLERRRNGKPSPFA